MHAAARLARRSLCRVGLSVLPRGTVPLPATALRGARSFASAPVLSSDAGSTTTTTTTSTTTTTTTTTSSAEEWDFTRDAAKLTPSAVVAQLDKYIIGQDDAKKAIAIALRNRWRRMRVGPELRNEIMPKNILMIGPTGVGKTEVARRLAKLVQAPFVKVEATKYTEVGFHGKDVDTIIRDLCEASFTLVKELKQKQLKAKVAPRVENRLLVALAGETASAATKEDILGLLRSGDMEHTMVEVDLPIDEGADAHTMEFGLGGGQSFMVDTSELIDRLRGTKSPRKTQRKRLTVKEARPLLEKLEVDAQVTPADLKKEAVELAEQHGIVVIDEIDKIVADKTRHRGGDASDEGVQRDLLPLIEGTNVEVRRFGNVRTDFVLFVCSGAFHSVKPSDMLAELQGRLPIRVELKQLSADDLFRILTEPKANLIDQQKALLAAEGVELEFTTEALREMADRAAEVNRTIENIGARRLHTVVERVMEDISFKASEMGAGSKVVVDKALVQAKLSDSLKQRDLKKFIL